ncbi:4-phosphopantetheinyl transferase [Nonlabens sp. MIC269]|uniref:4'-phosphopantetheinyl transferase family protein n=1 Tax=Nonlabens TaxID=363408 RepID=UPI00071F30CB|nr:MULTISPECIES: 4'-phosphopantetheinyl transferase superfamily protein [Nonlabens]ALM21130.1 4-phosphopantetheinyl transferase [Nonlabens sp. MIC269]ARN72148.1 4-phosphopantetheinyl transferase [Nonlabens tegetincola]MEE2802480.1 4'-phosphopantetheinyl transferase superfamily protein [Bacteroidota bacterium]
MPLYKTLNNRHNTVVHIWKITETEAQLRSGITLSENSKQRLLTMSSELHRRGFLSIRHLLHVAGYTDLELFYDDKGKPHLNDGKFISITHSYEFTAIIVSDTPVGIDIEKKREKIKRIAKKFIKYENTCVYNSSQQVKLLTIIWGAKESMYKLYGSKGLGFKAHCQVEPIDFSHPKSRCSIHFNGDSSYYDLFYLGFENFMMVYVIPA